MTCSFEVRVRILPREVGYLFWVWMNSEKSRRGQYSRQICKQAIIKLSLAYSFWKMLFIRQNLKHVQMPYFAMPSFLKLLIFFWLTLVDILCLEFISHHTKEILYVNTNFMGNQLWNKNKHFHFFLILILKQPVLLM